ncbi:protein boule-like isoform X1 [Acipenser ruthenus]|uniref:protein boule-like isoform X1 n=1 Tax=Acipenser ruthenus TaxID=7906 RepID=UPI002741C57A|nr:protein boule-like isoform X1 [Acipenser ruthenus]
MMENEITQTSSQTQTGSLSPPNGMPPSPGNHGNPTSAPRYGTVIPNRIFVGGIDFKTNENDLRKFFSHYGVVNEVKIVNDRAGVSKGYGFVTFETQDDAQKILQEADKLFFRDKKLNVGPAIRKQQVGIPFAGFPFSGSSPSVTPPAQATMYFTTSTGYPYTYHNGVAYFHAPEITSVPQHWPPRSISSSPVMVTQQAQPVLQQPACHYQAPTQCLPGQWQWSLPQVWSPCRCTTSPAPAVPVLYMQASDILYQTQELSQDGGCAPSILPMLEATVPEAFPEHGMQPAYHQVFTQSPVCMPQPPVLQQEPVKDQRLHAMHRGFSQSPMGLKPRYTRSSHYHSHKDYRPEESILAPPASTESLN